MPYHNLFTQLLFYLPVGICPFNTLISSFSCFIYLFYLVLVIIFMFLLSCRNLKKSLQSISPLILLGFGRLISTTGVDYQVSCIFFFFFLLMPWLYRILLCSYMLGYFVNYTLKGSDSKNIYLYTLYMEITSITSLVLIYHL